MKKTFYVTTPIYYPSGKLHIGSAYTTLFCDVYKRFKANQGYDAYFLTGMDEHGQKIEEKAKEANKPPKVYVDEIAETSKKLWEILDIKYDDFIQTTERRHEIVVEKIFDKLLSTGDIYLGEYEGHYCMPCESYFTPTQLGEGNTCPDCGRETTLLKEESYFLRLSKYQDRLLQFINDNPNFIKPESRKNEVVSFIEQGLEDLSVSRTTFDWGVKVPGNERHVIYVWIDALSNYISALGYTQDEALYNKYWLGDEVLHVVGKDILRFHAIYWPIMLMALDVPVSFNLYAHGWILMKDGKMSKSKGNVVYPEALVERYGLDAVRYYLLRELPYGNDGVFTPEDFVQRSNVDLANDFGNLVSRTASMINKYFDGNISKTTNVTEFDQSLIDMIEETKSKFFTLMNEYKPNRALEEVLRLVSRTNKYIDETLPWNLAKSEETKNTLQGVLYHLVEAIRCANIMLSMVLVETFDKVNKTFNISQHGYNDLYFGAEEAYVVSKEITPLFPRLDTKVEIEYIQELMAGKKKMEKPVVEEITIDDFMKVDIRVGEVVACEQHPSADRLLVSQVDLGFETRQIVSGIRAHYEPSQMVGKKVLVVTNLKPIKLRGVESFGMILAGSNDEMLEVIEAKNLTSGSIVK